MPAVFMITPSRLSLLLFFSEVRRCVHSAGGEHAGLCETSDDRKVPPLADTLQC